jgi:hypothetical protein
VRYVGLAFSQRQPVGREQRHLIPAPRKKQRSAQQGAHNFTQVSSWPNLLAAHCDGRQRCMHQQQDGSRAHTHTHTSRGFRAANFTPAKMIGFNDLSTGLDSGNLRVTCGKTVGSTKRLAAEGALPEQRAQPAAVFDLPALRQRQCSLSWCAFQDTCCPARPNWTSGVISLSQWRSQGQATRPEAERALLLRSQDCGGRAQAPRLL